MKNDLLLPAKLKPLGFTFLLIGLFLILLRYQFNYKPDFLNVKMFAFYTYYIESKSFTVVSNQMIEEFGAIFALVGLSLLAFSREKLEIPAFETLRLRAFMVASYVNLVFLIIALLFFFGFGFVGALTFFMGVWLISYILAFRYLIYRFRNNGEIKE